MLRLPDVTLIVVETRAHELCRRTLNDCMSKVLFGDVLIYTDKPESMKPLCGQARFAPVTDWPDKKAAGNFYYTDAAGPIKTGFALLMEWDAGIIDPTSWTDKFYDYDFIGAPWPWSRDDHPRDKMDVGNGGFSLWSKRLVDYVIAHRRDIPMYTDIDISRTHRRFIEKAGFRYADYDLAEQFAFEGWNGKGLADLPDGPSFGYHGVFNWPNYLGREDLLARARLIQSNDFLVRTGKLKELCRHAPSWLSKELGLPVAPTPSLRLPTGVRNNSLLRRQREAIMARTAGGRA